MYCKQYRSHRPPLGSYLIFTWKTIFIWIRALAHPLTKQAERVWGGSHYTHNRFPALRLPWLCSSHPSKMFLGSLNNLWALPLLTTAQRWLSNRVTQWNPSIAMGNGGYTLQLVFSNPCPNAGIFLSPQFVKSRLQTPNTSAFNDCNGEPWRAHATFFRSIHRAGSSEISATQTISIKGHTSMSHSLVTQQERK